MNSRIKAISIIIIIVITMAVLIGLIASNLGKKEQRKANNQYLPNLNLSLTDSTFINTKTFRSNFTILIFFNSECDYCVYEAGEIRRAIHNLSNINIIFTSTEELTLIRKFGEVQDLLQYQNVYFGQISHTDLSETFGHLSLPHIFIYDSSQKFIKEFKGETKVEAILKYVRQ